MTNLHILLDTVTDFWKCSKKGFKFLLLLTFLSKVGSLIGSNKTQFKNLQFGMVVNWHKCNVTMLIISVKMRGHMKYKIMRTLGTYGPLVLAPA